MAKKIRDLERDYAVISSRGWAPKIQIRPCACVCEYARFAGIKVKKQGKKGKNPNHHHHVPIRKEKDKHLDRPDIYHEEQDEELDRNHKSRDGTDKRRKAKFRDENGRVCVMLLFRPKQ